MKERLLYYINAYRHFGRYNEPAIRNGELSELTYPKSPINNYTVYKGDSAQASSRDTFLSRFTLLCGMTATIYCPLSVVEGWFVTNE